MTSLLRSRGSTAEMAELFAAVADPGLVWPQAIWTGEQVPVVAADEIGQRRLTTMRWGLLAEAFARPIPAKQRGVIYSRDFWRTGSRLDDVSSLTRCLIALESFAYPRGLTGQCTREWIGRYHDPLVAWAGVCVDGACAGVLILANSRIEGLSKTMPRLLMPEDHAAWLDGGTLLSLGPSFADGEFYGENFEERWSTGKPIDELPLFKAASCGTGGTEPASPMRRGEVAHAAPQLPAEPGSP